ncbi:40S ribosomal protein S13 [Batrachochytrium salamandrivorans]|nr:40S ribosomal protein S13 [Batrachochytrium salamandrivorans]
MFFTHDILLRHSGNRKQNSLAVVWLAATLGQRNAYKKLGRKEVNGVDLIQTCIVFGADNQYAQLKPNDGGRPSLCAPDKLLLCSERPEESETPLTKMHSKSLIEHIANLNSMPDSPLAGKKHGRTARVALPSLSSNQSHSILPSNDYPGDILSAGFGTDSVDPLLQDFGGMQQDDFDIFADYPAETLNQGHHAQKSDYPSGAAADNAMDTTWFVIPATALDDTQHHLSTSVPTNSKKIKLAAKKHLLFDEAISLADEYNWRSGEPLLSNKEGAEEFSGGLERFWRSMVTSHFEDVATGRKRQILDIVSSRKKAHRRQGPSDDLNREPNNGHYGGDANFDSYDFGLGEEQQVQSAEIGRAVAPDKAMLESRMSPKVMPWHIPSATNSVVSELRSRHRFNNDTPSSLSASMGMASLAGRSREHDRHIFEGDLGTNQLFLPADPELIPSVELDTITTTRLQQQSQTLDKESSAFYGYIRSIMTEAASDTVHLFDILEHINSRTVASHAFFNVFLLFLKMGRMHAPGKGISSSALPYRRTPATWLKTTPTEVIDQICKLAKKGLTPSQIGVILRDSHGIAQVRFVTGNKILRILKSNGLAPEIPEDLYQLIKKAVMIRKHLERNRKDNDGKFRLILVESRIHRLARYYKTVGQLPPNWKYESSTASTLVA